MRDILNQSHCQIQIVPTVARRWGSQLRRDAHVVGAGLKVAQVTGIWRLWPGFPEQTIVFSLKDLKGTPAVFKLFSKAGFLLVRNPVEAT